MPRGDPRFDSANDHALTTLPRHYRALGKWEKLDKLYEKHASVTGDESRRVELLMQRARVLAENIGSPDRATRVYEQVLELQPGHAGALEALARLRELSGDAHAALSAIEALAGKAATPEAKAEQWTRAARLLDGRGDRDGAIERYKLALEANPKDVGASAALRQAYTARGDAASVVQLVEKELEHAEGKMAKARLHAELARVQREKLRDNDKAEASARTANDLDPTNAEALLVLGDLAYEGQRYLEAMQRLETLVGRAQALPKEDAVRAIVRYVEAYGRSVTSRASQPAISSRDGSRESIPPSSIASSHPRLAAAVDALAQIAPDDAEALARVGRVVFDAGDAQMARAVYERILERHGSGAVARGARAGAVAPGRVVPPAGGARQGGRRIAVGGRLRSRQPRASAGAGARLRADGRLGGIRPHQAPSPRAGRRRREVRAAARDRRRRVREAQ